MSSSLNSTELSSAYGTIGSINFTGGFPTHVDLAPSIIFAIVYFLSLPVLFWRIFSPRHRCIALIRITIFVFCRLAMLIMRAYMADHEWGIGLLIAQLVLVGVGYLFLVEPLSSLWKRLVYYSMPAPRPGWVFRIEIFLRVALLAAVACIAASGGLTSNAFYSSSSLQTVIDLRRASYCIALGVVAINCILLFVTFFTLHLDTTRTLYLIPPHIALLIAGIYRVAQTFEENPSSPIRSKAAFWIMEIFFEFVAYCCFIGISIPEFFPKPVDDVPVETNYADKAERGQTTTNTTSGNPSAPRKKRGFLFRR